MTVVCCSGPADLYLLRLNQRLFVFPLGRAGDGLLPRLFVLASGRDMYVWIDGPV